MREKGIEVTTDEAAERAAARSPDDAGAAASRSPDRGLAQWFLSLTPAQRLETLQNTVNLAMEARNAREARRLP
jgi:hypothetical protein